MPKKMINARLVLSFSTAWCRQFCASCSLLDEHRFGTEACDLEEATRGSNLTATEGLFHRPSIFIQMTATRTYV